MKLSKNWESFFIYIIIILGILLLRLAGNYPSQLILLSQGMVLIGEKIIESFGLTDLLEIFHVIPLKVFIFIGGIIQMTIGLIILLISKKHMEQGTMILLKQPIDTIKTGLCLYFLIAAIFFVFAYSVIGIPISIIIILISHFIVLIGNIPLSIFLGYLFAEKLNISGYTIIYYFIGSFVRLLCESIYTLSGAFLFFIFPVLSIGTFFFMIVNQKFYKLYHTVIFKTKAKETNFNKKKMKNIITKGLKE